ncbi:MAG TPA: hypothetical protein VE954_27835 [Oligoflexus sp.]|uniref:hypothetical protein n=1 Tax=Oligoflexus sp. TaxID=1971216 RepID=UPI002D625B22|nr:hypothetical protein [Oligoflexus sp.]HYX36936.1 hypothetical protein [Oligoflexus sp.]
MKRVVSSKIFLLATIAAYLVLVAIACGSNPRDRTDSLRKQNSEAVPDTGDPSGNSDQKPAVDLQNQIIFDRLVPKLFQDKIRDDMGRIERLDLETGTDNDAILRSLLQLQDLKAATMSTWLKARIHYMIGENLSDYKLAAIISRDKTYQVFHLPPETQSSNIAAAMSGTSVYTFGKSLKISNAVVDYVMIEVNDSWVHANALRNGVMQIGPALFDSRFQPDPTNEKAYSNTIQRMAVYFHEARHADGNSAAHSLGFPHIICPAGAGVPTELIGKPACDDSSNGAYSISYRMMKAYVDKCGKLCSRKDKTVLEAIVLDNLSRVIKQAGAMLPALDVEPEPGLKPIDIQDFQPIFQ